jgi:hypothetical protein
MGLQSLNLSEIQYSENVRTETVSESRKKFFRRQFQSDMTTKQKVFDWLFGVVLPVICFVADPIVFKGYGMGKGALLGSLKPFAYLLSFTLVMTLSAKLIWNEKLKWLNAFLSGLFAVGTIISLCVGIVLLPLSLLGLFFIIGILGFTPFLSGFVYLRSSVCCFKSSGTIFKKQSLIGAFVLSTVLSVTIPMLVNIKIYKSLKAMKSGSVVIIQENANSLKYFSPLINFDSLGGSYCELPESDEHQALAEVYQRFSGESIERIDFHICEDW